MPGVKFLKEESPMLEQVRVLILCSFKYIISLEFQAGGGAEHAVKCKGRNRLKLQYRKRNAAYVAGKMVNAYPTLSFYSPT